MAFVKLDCRMLDSTIWLDKDARDIFITALLMAHPHELRDQAPQLELLSDKETGFIVPAGWYGFVDAGSPNIIDRTRIDMERGMSALSRLGEPEGVSKSTPFGGRRMVRVERGFIILNYDHYRRKDHTTAERSKRYRERKQSSNPLKVKKVKRHAVTPRGVTQAEAYTEPAPKPRKYNLMSPTDDGAFRGL